MEDFFISQCSMVYNFYNVYVFFLEDPDATKEITSKESPIQLYCIPPNSHLLSKINITFSKSCGSGAGNNTITITQETAWRHNHCICTAHGPSYSVSKKFNLKYDGASKVCK